MLRLLERASEQRVAIPALTSTDYVNTIPTELEPWFPGDEDVERRFRAWIRWNAAIMVHRAQRPGVGVGARLFELRATSGTPDAVIAYLGATARQCVLQEAANKLFAGRKLRS
jgi:pyruvate dehydrogenase complex dehydrogenase (E1) component